MTPEPVPANSAVEPAADSAGPSPEALRQRAEALAHDRAGEMPENLDALSHEAARSALHELRVHQIELDLQNEELRRAQQELEASQERYFDLYNLAPVGYFTLNDKSLILEANLGLPVVLGILRSHAGAVTVENQLGRGSTFRIFLPLSTEPVRHQPQHTAEYPEIDAGGTVLLVDDEEMVRKVCGTALTTLGFKVLLAKDGVEAVEVFRQHQDEIRCVLCDLTMPRMDGWETLAALRKLAPGIPVILASGYSKAHVMAGDHAEMPEVLLSKPFQFQGLRDAIGRALADGKKT